MISLYVLFGVSVVLFAIIGAIRGWSKEVIAMAGLILSLFAINTFGSLIVRLTGGIAGSVDPNDILGYMRRQFIVLGSIHVIIAFFSYQSVVLVGGRLSGRERFQERLLGLIFGAINGYLVVGTLWSLLEYQLTADGWIRLPPDFPYAFDPSIIRPDVTTAAQELLVSHLPIPWLVPWLPILLVLIFLFVIIVVI
jgi:hypothetical protein